jgi:hypothetical protein
MRTLAVALALVGLDRLGVPCGVQAIFARFANAPLPSKSPALAGLFGEAGGRTRTERPPLYKLSQVRKLRRPTRPNPSVFRGWSLPAAPRWQVVRRCLWEVCGKFVGNGAHPPRGLMRPLRQKMAVHIDRG